MPPFANSVNLSPISRSSVTLSQSSDLIDERRSVREDDDPEKALTPQISTMSERLPVSRIGTSLRTTGTTDPNFEVNWEEDDPQNPKNWPVWYKGVTLGFVSWSTCVYVALYLPVRTSIADPFEQSSCILHIIYN